MTELTNFQGVVCCCLDKKTTVQESIIRLLDLKTTSKIRDIECANLELKNKYYEATVHLFDIDSITKHQELDLIKDCHAIILYADGVTLSCEQLDASVKQLDNVQGEPRILICNNIDEDCRSYATLRDWATQNSYDLLLTTEPDVRIQLIDSLSAYKWRHRFDTIQTDTSAPRERLSGGDRRELDDELLKKLTDFDTLLNKLGAYRDRPELRGNPDDKNIEEIAEILTGLLGDDVDNFLENEDLNEATNGQSKHDETRTKES